MLASSATPFSVKDILNLTDQVVDELDPQALLYQAQSLEKAFFEESVCSQDNFSGLDPSLAIEVDSLSYFQDNCSSVAQPLGVAPNHGQNVSHFCLPYHTGCFDVAQTNFAADDCYVQATNCRQDENASLLHQQHMAQQMSARAEQMNQQFLCDQSEYPVFLPFAFVVLQRSVGTFFFALLFAVYNFNDVL